MPFKRTLIAVSALMLVAGVCLAGDTTRPAGDMEMPPMGPPDEMVNLRWLEGTWDVAMKSRMSDTIDIWTDAVGTAVYEFILDGAVLKVTYQSEMMGMPFKGMMLQAFDRELQQWQATWVDNMSSRLSIYTGHDDGQRLVLTGEDIYMGEKLTTRITSIKTSEIGFDWTMEHSADGGQTFWTSATATYVKR
ncbi:MAG: DUF1579 family protein [Candidatus Zixiibacteriota bacterium]|nr:MAG: DUF1579 family protein [candidate division Zixibacteria bacterium]